MLKTILKFDAGTGGFKAMIYVLAVTAVIVLLAGIIVIMTTF